MVNKLKLKCHLNDELIAIKNRFNSNDKIIFSHNIKLGLRYEIEIPKTITDNNQLKLYDLTGTTKNKDVMRYQTQKILKLVGELNEDEKGE